MRFKRKLLSSEILLMISNIACSESSCFTDVYKRQDQYRGHIQQIYGWRGGFKTPSGDGKWIIENNVITLIRC